MLQLREEPLDVVPLSVEALAKAGLPLAIAFRWDIGCGTLLLDQFADAIGIIGLVGEDDGARAEVVEQRVGDPTVMRLSCRQAEPDREALRVDDDMDLGREPTSAATEAMIWPPFLPSQPAGALGWKCCRSSGWCHRARH